MLDFTRLPQPVMLSQNSNQMLMPNTSLVDPIIAFQNTQDPSLSVDGHWASSFVPQADWTYPELPSDLHNMLSEFYVS